MTDNVTPTEQEILACENVSTGHNECSSSIFHIAQALAAERRKVLDSPEVQELHFLVVTFRSAWRTGDPKFFERIDKALAAFEEASK